MDETELRAEVVKLGIEANGDVEALRRKVQAELDQRWKEKTANASKVGTAGSRRTDCR